MCAHELYRAGASFTSSGFVGRVVNSVSTVRPGIWRPVHCAPRYYYATVAAPGSCAGQSITKRRDSQWPEQPSKHATKSTCTARSNCPSNFGWKSPSNRRGLSSRRIPKQDAGASGPKHTAFIALGSNLGLKLETIEQACRELESHTCIKLVRTSGLWQTKAMYVTDQDDFLNGACEIETSLDPLELLNTLQHIEDKLGRVRVIDKGPRTLDLDILLYDDRAIASDRLVVPHMLMLEREFVLRPLCQLIPNGLSTKGISFSKHLSKLARSETPMSTMTTLSGSLSPLQTLLPSRNTRVMSIFNATPDSFSDGGVHNPSDPDQLASTITSHFASGGEIIDIGGQSTRPGAKPVSAEEEISRILPAIKVARSLMSSDDQDTARALKGAISVDTYRASVARAAVAAGADIINDVSAGALDPDMLSTMAELGCTIILMHMRGDPATMNSKEHTRYPDGLVETVGRELLARVKAAEAAGVRRWRIILDPGVGFAKTQDQNLELLRRLAELKAFPGLEGYPWIVGTSKKSFVGKITGVEEASARNWGTAAAVAASVHGGADIVRVHDVADMAKVVKMADAIWRPT